MSRTFVGLFLLLLAVTPVAGQPAPSGAPIHLTLHPAALPVPALRYPLLPDPEKAQPGNAAAIYYRSQTLLSENRPLLEDLQQDHWDRWFITPLKELPLEQVRDKLAWTKNLIHEVEVATHYRRCDWEVEGRSEDVGVLTPDLRGFRRAAVVLGVRARADMAEGHFPEAIQSLQTGYTLAHDLGQGPSFNHVLVGEIIVNLMDYQLEELVQQPGAPNLYWSLTVLPRPFFQPQLALDEEATALERTWPWLRRLENGPMTAEQVRAAQEEIRKSLGDTDERRPNTDKVIQEAYPEARKELLAQGLTSATVDAMPPFQVVALAAWRAQRRTWVEMVKWFRLPHGWHQPGYLKSTEEYQRALGRLDRLIFGGLAHNLELSDAAAVLKVYTTGEVLDQRCTALRCVEAIRLYAAGHKGQLPPTLKDVREVPLPNDPVTGKPFEYEVHGDSARLATPMLPGDGSSAPALVYELRLQP